MTSQLVRNTVLDSAQKPIPNSQVRIYLVPGPAGAALDANAQASIGTPHVPSTDRVGYWGVPLQPNLGAGAITNPAGTYYRVQEPSGATWTIQINGDLIPPADGWWVGDPAILVQDPASPGAVIAGGVPFPGASVPAGEVWTTDGHSSGSYQPQQGGGGGISALTGDVTAAGTGSVAATLAAVGSAGTTGDASHVAQVTTDAKGRVTAKTAVSIQVAESQVTNLTTDLAAKAPLASPAITGTPTAPTAAPGANSTQLATTAYADAAAIAATVGLLDYRGTFNASSNTFPTSGGSGAAGAILKGDFWIVSTPGALGGTAVSNGDLVIALIDAPGSTAANWDLVEHDVGYAPENVANKSTDGTLAANSTTLYPSQSAVKAYADTKTPSSRLITAGSGLTGGGDLTADRTLAVDTGTVSGKIPVLGTGGVLAIGRLATGTPDGTKFVRDDGTLAVPAGGTSSALTRTAVKTANYTAALWDLVPCDTSGGAFTVTLPAASGGKGRIAIKLVTAGNTLNLALTGSDHFNTSAGPTTGSLSLTNQTLSIESDGSGIWTVTSDDLPLSGLDARYVLASVVTTKGDLLVATGSATPARLAVGSDGQVVRADSTQASGVRWATKTFQPASVMPSGNYIPLTQTAASGPNTTQIFSGAALGRGAAIPFVFRRKVTPTSFSIYVATLAASSFVRLGIYADNGSDKPGALVIDYGQVDTSTTGLKSWANSQQYDGDTQYWFLVVVQGAGNGTLQVYSNQAAPGVDIGDPAGATAAQNNRMGFDISGVTGAMPANLTSSAVNGGVNNHVRVLALIP